MKIISAVLSLVILFECNAPAYAEVKAWGSAAWPSFESSFDLFGAQESSLDAALEDAYMKGSEGNIHEAAFNEEIAAALRTFEKNTNRATIAALIKEGRAKYGANASMYVRAKGGKALNSLETELGNFLASQLLPKQVMPYKDFEKLFNDEVKKTAAAFVKANNLKTQPPFTSAEAAVISEILSFYPVKTAYNDYKKEAYEDNLWRNNNGAKIVPAVYNVARKYIDAIGAENLSLPVLAYLYNLKIGSKEVLTQADRQAVYNYSVSRLETQNYKVLDIGITSGKSDKKVASYFLRDTIDLMVAGGFVAKNDGGRFAKAVEKAIYSSEDGSGFSNILATGFSALLAVKDYNALRRVLKHYTEQENSSASVWDYINFTFYAGKVKTSGGRYLGRASVRTQYSTSYIYSNTFSDLAKLLAEDGSQEALSVLKEYGVNKGFDKAIRPFLAGALLSGKSGADTKTAQDYALKLANLTLGDVAATQEYDLDRALLRTYPAIKANLSSNAMITEARYNAGLDRNKNLRYLDRAALSLDILLAVWGTVGLAKLGGKAVSLSRSVYTAVKAGRIADNAKRLAFLKANYAKLGGYISARNSMLRLNLRVKNNTLKLKALFTGKPAKAPALSAQEARQAAKLQNYYDKKELASLYEARRQAVTEVRAAAEPTARQQARAELATARYKAKKAQIDFRLKMRLYGTGVDAKNAAYLAEVERYNSAVRIYNSKIDLLNQRRAEGAAASVIEALEAELDALAPSVNTPPVPPLFTAGEASLLKANTLFDTSLKTFNTAKSNYQATSWWNRNITQPWKNWTAASSASTGDGTLGLWRLETDPGITLAEAWGITRPYNPDYTKGLRLFGNSADYTSPASKFYAFLDRHHLKPLSSSLKFINNRATLLGTTLLFNYNVATITPEALNFGRTFGQTTELVANLGRTTEAASWARTASIPLKTTSFPALKPVSVIDPKVLQFYNAVPLPGGNIINSLSFKNFIGSTGTALFTAGAALSMPFMLGRDWYAAVDRKILNLPAANAIKTPSFTQSYGSSSYNIFGSAAAQNWLNQKAAQNGGWALFAPGEWNDFVQRFGNGGYVYEIPAVSNHNHSVYTPVLSLQPSFIPAPEVYDNLENLEGYAMAEEALAASSVLPYSADLQDRHNTMSVISADGSGTVLPVKLTFNEGFDAKGYTNIVFNNNIAELREFDMKPRVMSNFYLRLNTAGKSFLKFVNTLKAVGETITVKLWQYGIEPSKTATVTLYYGDGKEALPVKVITDANYVANGRKLVLTPSGAIGVMSAEGGMPDILPNSVLIRLPKNQINTLLKVLAASDYTMPIEVMPSYDKAAVVIKEGYYINPSLGKTLGPVLPESLGVSEAFATNLMYVVNYLPGILSPLLNPLVKKYGEVAMFKVSIVISMLAALLPALFGFYGYSAGMEPTTLRTISLGISLFALAFSINIRNVVGNSLINMNRGAMPIAKDKKKEEKTVTEAAKITMDILLDKFKKLFSSSSNFSMEDILYYNRSFINKNLGTMAFLVAPSLLNFAGRAVGFDFGFGWDVSLPLYALYSAYAGYKVHKTNLRDNKIIDHIKNDVYQAAEAASAEEAVEAAATTESAAAEAVKPEKKNIWKDVAEVFKIMGKEDGVMSIVVGMSLATAHELSISSAFSSTLYELIPDGDKASLLVISVLYGSLMLGRLLGNITTTRMSSGTSYFSYSALSALGTAAILGGIMADSPAAIVTGGVIASIGIGNYFSQMFAYIIRKHPELQSQISQALSFTMPIAVMLSMPITYLNDWTGLPYARVMASLAMLVASLVATRGMLDNSTLYKFVVQEFKEASDYVVGLFKGKSAEGEVKPEAAQTPETPASEQNPEAK